MSKGKNLRSNQYSFVVLPNPILALFAKHGNGLLIYLNILKRADYEKATAFPSLALLCRETGLAHNTVLKEIEWLVENGIILREKRFREDGGITSNLYTIVGFDEIIARYATSKNEVGHIQNLNGGDIQNLNTNKESVFNEESFEQKDSKDSSELDSSQVISSNQHPTDYSEIPQDFSLIQEKESHTTIDSSQDEAYTIEQSNNNMGAARKLDAAGNRAMIAVIAKALARDHQLEYGKLTKGDTRKKDFDTQAVVLWHGKKDGGQVALSEVWTQHHFSYIDLEEFFKARITDKESQKLKGQFICPRGKGLLRIALANWLDAKSVKKTEKRLVGYVEETGLPIYETVEIESEGE